MAAGFLLLSLLPPGCSPVAPRTPATGGPTRTFTVQRSQATTTLTLAGLLMPGDTRTLHAPIDGRITALAVVPGEQVSAGQILLELDGQAHEDKLRRAETELLKASIAEEQLRHWDRNGDVIRARNALESARLAMDEASRRAEESRMLHERGIIATQEYEGAQQQLRNLALQTEMARHDLEAALMRGGPRYRRMASLDQESARRHLAMLRQAGHQRQLSAPVAGVVLALEGGRTSAAPAELAVGLNVSQGQPLLRIATLEHLVAVGRVSEMDVTSLRQDMPVELSITALPQHKLKGRLVRIAAQASAANELSPLPGYDLMVSLETAPAKHQAQEDLRPGMSAVLTIQLGQVSQIVIPHEFLMPGADLELGQGQVLLRDPVSGKSRQHAVVLGDSTAQGRVVTAGLDEGMVLVARIRN
jgi:multidrug efflux pump subunit AcrA (membrane-fusion protein)